MRILFICGAGTVAGKEMQTLESMIGLKQLGHEIHCVVSSWNTGEFPAMLKANNIAWSTLRIGFISLTPGWTSLKMTLHQLMFLPSLYWNYNKLLKTWQPSVIVHCNFHHVFLMMPLLANPAQVFQVHDVFQVKPLFVRLFKLFNKRIDLFIGVSKYVCKNLESLGVPSNKIELVYNSIRTSSTTGPKPSHPVPVIAIVGQIGSWKGHEVLLKALSTLKEQQWILNIIGSGDKAYIGFLTKLAEESGIADRVIFRGKINGLQNIYQGIDIACVPSTISESFGLSAAEPGFFGIPTVASDLGGLPEVVIHNKTGIIVPTNDATSLAKAIHLLLNDSQLRQQFGDAAREHVSQSFSLENNAVRMDALLKKLSKP